MTTKERLLYILEQRLREPDLLSGEEAAKALHVSRVAVWKAVESLRKEGFPIESAQSAGYRLDPACDKLHPARVRAHLPAEFASLPVFTYDTIDSTNKQAKLFAGNDRAKAALFVSNEQTQGRGRLGRSFYSPANTGVYFSVLFSSSASLEALSVVTPFAAVACAQSLEEACGKRIGIKWVNDLYLKDKKICGILTEAITAMDEGCENKIVVGIGVNLNTGTFPEELTGKAGSLGVRINRAELCAKVAGKILSFAENPTDRSFMEEYRSRSIVLKKKVTLSKWGDTFEGIVDGFDDNGGLILDMEGEKRTFTGGEISLFLH